MYQIIKKLIRINRCKGKGPVRQGRVWAKAWPGTDMKYGLSGVEWRASSAMRHVCVGAKWGSEDRTEHWTVAFSLSGFKGKEVTAFYWVIMHVKCSFMIIFIQVLQIQFLNVLACGT